MTYLVYIQLSSKCKFQTSHTALKLCFNRMLLLHTISMLFSLSKLWVNIPMVGSSWRRSGAICPLEEQSCRPDIPKHSGGFGLPLFNKRQFF